MHKTIDKILAELMAREGLSQVQLSARANVGQSTISRILKPNGPKGIKEPTDKQVRPLADFFGMTTDQLRGFEPFEVQDGSLREERPSSTTDVVRDMLARASKVPESLKQKILEVAQQPDDGKTNVIVADFSRPGKVGDEVWIAHYDIRGAMGGGEVTHDYPEMLQDVRVSPSQLRSMGVEFAEHYHLKMITGWGQSMSPTIKHGDPLLVNINIREFVGDGIYLFSYQGFEYIKRLQKKGKDMYKMLSDNTLHPPEDIWAEETYIQAKVLLVWNSQLV
ncbi:XRE family transcriptional regulator [Pseudomonas syringae]|uniref:Repressor n=1 Tax=Pseudomonas syringae TaxID=317 RepID=A0A085VQX2_PSESX|nr:LexA family transcriptional regulator [Pseudomonas syringae]KFE57835.1 repressor [Pseudomonas syringae]